MKILGIRNYELRKDKGFSLIELLVVISMILVITGFSYMAFSSITTDQKMKKAVKEVKTFLYKARQEAFYNKKPYVGCDPYEGNEIHFTENSIYFDPVCDETPETDYRETLNFENGVSLTGGETFIFLSNGDRTDLSDDTGVTVAVGEIEKTIKITTLGEIYEEDE